MSELDKLEKSFQRLKDSMRKTKSNVSGNSRWSSSRLWLVVGTLLGLIWLQRSGFQFGVLLDHCVFLVVVFLVTRTITDVSTQWSRVWQESVRIRYGVKESDTPMNDDPT